MDQSTIRVISHRKCTLEDLKELQTLARDIFYNTYKDQNTSENMAKYLEKAFNEEQIKKELNNPHSEFHFTLMDDEVVGYIKTNEHDAQTEYQTADTLEIERIYLKPNLQGKGLGRYMIGKVMELARWKRKSKVWLGVWQKNPKAIGFYKKHGFEIVGTHTFMFVDEEQMDWIMERTVE